MDNDDDANSNANANADDSVDQPAGLTSSQAFKLYISHFFSTWNARGYEFAAILFTAAAYPDTLVAAALRMIVVYFAMILFSASIGRWVQASPSRLRALLTTIVVNRGSVIVGGCLWLLILSQEDLVVGREGEGNVLVLPKNDAAKHLLFAAAIACGIVERLSSAANLISMERDWVVTVAGPPGHAHDLTGLNAVMRRIDLVCKLVSPILISVVISALGSVRVGVVYTVLTSALCIPVEVLSARRVYASSPALQVPKPAPAPEPVPAGSTSTPWRTRVRRYFKGFEMYFSTKVWIPSLALSMLHFNILTWRATFITYLINVGYSLTIITVARAIGSVFEISSTVATPRGVERLGKAHGHRGHVQQHDEDDDDDDVGRGLLRGEPRRDEQTMTGLMRTGLWGFTWQVVNTVPVVVACFAISAMQDGDEDASSSTFTSFTRRLSTSLSPLDTLSGVTWSLVLFAFLAFSRFGLWAYDLTTQQLAQTLVPEQQRSSFAGVETSISNIFEVCGAGAAIAFPQMEQFKWLALASFVTLVVGWVMYAGWVRAQRGHLFHAEKLACR